MDAEFQPERRVADYSHLIRVLELPIQFFQKDVLFSIARMIGIPLRIDESIAFLVRPEVARVCGEINLLDQPVKEMRLGFGTTTIILPVIYEGLL